MSQDSVDVLCKKSQRLTNISQFRPWVWCVVLQILISFPCTLSLCLGVVSAISMYPSGDVFIPYGDPLDLYCVSENRSLTADDIYFSIGNEILYSERINSTTRKLHITKPQRQWNTYNCKSDIKGTNICSSRVFVDIPPENATDFHCISKSLEKLTCTWTSPNSFIKLNYSISFEVNSHETIALPGIKSFNNSWYCTWTLTSQPFYRQLLDYYVFHLKSCNRFGCNTQMFLIDHYSVVKSDKPANFVASATGPHSAQLRWNLPGEMDVLTCGVDHKIEYQIAKVDNITQFHPVDTSLLPHNKRTYKFELTDLPYAYTKYEVRVYIKSRKAGDEYWSEYSFYFFTTAMEIPSKPPEMISGSFVPGFYDKKTYFYVYWKQIEEYEQGGANFTYKVLAEQNGKSQVLYADKNSLSYALLTVAEEGAVYVSVWSYNVNGSSVNKSTLYIPSKERIFSGMNSFTQVANKNGTYDLSWDKFEKVDNYSLFWCEHNSPKMCSGRLNFTILSPEKTNYAIHLPKDLKYQFAIAANKGLATTGMVWAECDIAREGLKLYNFPVELERGPAGITSIRLKWSLNCARKEKIITGYRITYCPVIKDTTSCDNTVGNRSVNITNPDQMEINVTGLLPSRTYQFSIALNTTNGLKSVENKTLSITTLESVPTNPRNIYITDVKYDSVVVSWDPPLYENGKIQEFVIYTYFNGSVKGATKREPFSIMSVNRARRSLTITGLYPFTNYTFSVQACNVNPALNYCSEIYPRDGVLFNTAIGPPEKMEPPSIIGLDLLKWNPPSIPGGTVDMYQIQRISDRTNEKIFNTTGLSYKIKHCDSANEVTYQVRALNLDEHPNHGVECFSFCNNISLPVRNSSLVSYPGDWSVKSNISCPIETGMTVVIIIMTIFVLFGMGYGFYKLYLKYKRIQDIKPVLPVGLGIPQKDISQYAFISNNEKDDKPSSDETLLLPNSNTSVCKFGLKQDDNNCSASNHTDSTALSDASRQTCLPDRQVSTTENGLDSSFNLKEETVKNENNKVIEDESTESEGSETSSEVSPYLSDGSKKRGLPGVSVQPVEKNAVVPSANSGYVTNVPMKPTVQPSSSYVMAGLPSTMYPNANTPHSATTHVPTESGYVLAANVQGKSLDFSQLRPSPTKMLGPESLPSMPTLPNQPPNHQAKMDTQSNYIQLQTLDNISSHKPVARNTVPMKPAASSSYVSPGDTVITKHLNNILTSGQHVEEPAVLDPTMSRDAYSRFSWSNHPTNDNIHSLLNDPPTIDSQN